MKRDWDSFVSIVPDVEDVLDDDRQCRQCAEGHAKVSYQRVRHNVGDQKTASRTTDPDAEVSERFGEVGHGVTKEGLPGQQPAAGWSAIKVGWLHG